MKNKKIAIVFNKKINNSQETVKNLENALILRSARPEILEMSELKQGFDFVFVVGGDGTILKAARFFAPSETPVFGINLGRLGFLSQSKETELTSAVDKILDNKFKVEDRIMIETADVLALNDLVIKGATAARTSRLYLKINDKFVCDYLADGIIISTPTGSTAYGLSAGGPVLTPSLDALVIVPICPHTLTARPLVVPAEEKITISTCEAEEFIVTADGQNSYNFSSSIDVKKSPYVAKLALLEGDEFYSVLREKLHWGISPKN